MSIAAFDHVAIPIENVEEMLSFYRRLGFNVTEENAPFYSILFENQKINFHGPALWRSSSFTLRGPTALPGCGDFCFVWEGTVQALMDMLTEAGAKVIEGPVERTGGRDEGRAIR